LTNIHLIYIETESFVWVLGFLVRKAWKELDIFARTADKALIQASAGRRGLMCWFELKENTIS
jgi:hypothetical protein